MCLMRIYITFFMLCIIPKGVRAAVQAGGKGEELSPLALFALFVNLCKENLHIVVAFSPIGDAFRNRLRQFPSLINCCTIDWFQVRENTYIISSKICFSFLTLCISKCHQIFFCLPCRSTPCFSKF